MKKTITLDEAINRVSAIILENNYSDSEAQRFFEAVEVDRKCLFESTIAECIDDVCDQAIESNKNGEKINLFSAYMRITPEENEIW